MTSFDPETGSSRRAPRIASRCVACERGFNGWRRRLGQSCTGRAPARSLRGAGRPAGLTRASAAFSAAFSTAVLAAVSVAFSLAVLAAPPAAAARTADGAPVVAAFGDSLVAGFGLPVADGFAPQLQAWLRENGRPGAVVLNAGVSGDTTAGGLARVDFSLTQEVDAVILELGANDMLRNVPVAQTRANLIGIMDRLAERGLPVLVAGMGALSNYGADYKAEFEALYPMLAETYDAELYPFFLAGVAGEPSLNLPDRIHPNAEGVRVIVERIGPAVLRLLDKVDAAAAPAADG